MGKNNRCSDLNLNDAGSIFFWGLIVLLFLLVIGNFILTMTIISFFKIGMGMESIKLVPEMKAIKFYGIADFNRVFKRDGLVESFREAPLTIESDKDFIKFDLVDRKGNVNNLLIMGSNGTDIKGVNQILIKNPETKLPIFASTKLQYNMEKPTMKLEASAVYTAELVSPIDRGLKIASDFQSIHLRGIEGTLIDGKEIFVSSEQNIFLKSSNGTIFMSAQNGIYIDIDRIQVARDHLFNHVPNDLQSKLCICYPKGVLYRVKLSKTEKGNDPCRHFDRRQFNPCF